MASRQQIHDTRRAHQPERASLRQRSSTPGISPTKNSKNRAVSSCRRPARVLAPTTSTARCWICRAGYAISPRSPTCRTAWGEVTAGPLVALPAVAAALIAAGLWALNRRDLAVS